MQRIRKQLTLFIDDPGGNIEKIRSKFNPVQFKLIPAHITLCREDEIEPIAQTIQRIKSISIEKPIRIVLNELVRFDNGKGVFISTSGSGKEFVDLRKKVLGQPELKKEQVPHLTLMHPRNSTCTDEIFNLIKVYNLPSDLEFHTISLIEQINGGKWRTLEQFEILNNNTI